MTDYTISSKISNEMVYACYRGRFWYWNGSIWKESRIMTHRFELARAADKNLTPQSFLTNGAEFAPLDEYEIDCAMLDALENAKPCKNAPIDPVEEDSSSSVPASCICSTCTCGGCKEECFGNCHSCGHPVQECNSYQTEGEKHLTPAHSADVDKPEVPGTQTTQNKPLTTVPDEMRPAFDYSGLDAQTVDDLHFAEKEYQHGKKLAERGLVHMGNAIAAAHDALCGTVVQQLDNGEDGACRTLRKARNNQHSEDTFKSWCLSIGITKDSAYRLLQVSALMDGSSPRQRAILEALPPTLLYAVAKPSAPAELVAQVKSGDITTHKQYQEALAQIKAEKERADAAEAERDKLLGAQNRAAWAESHIQDVEAQRDAALADVQGLTEQNAKLKERADSAEAREEEAWKLQSKSEAKAKDAETELEAVTADLNGLYDRAAQAEARNTALLDERAEYVQRIKELESRPIEVMHDPEETDRLAHQYAYGIAADMTEELRTKNNRQSQTIAALQKELAEARSTNGYDPQSDLETVCACIGGMEQLWGTALPAYERLTGKDLRTATDTLQDAIGRLYGDMARTAEDGED